MVLGSYGKDRKSARDKANKGNPKLSPTHNKPHLSRLGGKFTWTFSTIYSMGVYHTGCFNAMCCDNKRNEINILVFHKHIWIKQYVIQNVAMVFKHYLNTTVFSKFPEKTSHFKWQFFPNQLGWHKAYKMWISVHIWIIYREIIRITAVRQKEHVYWNITWFCIFDF